MLTLHMLSLCKQAYVGYITYIFASKGGRAYCTKSKMTDYPDSGSELTTACPLGKSPLSLKWLSFINCEMETHFLHYCFYHLYYKYVDSVIDCFILVEAEFWITSDELI